MSSISNFKTLLFLAATIAALLNIVYTLPDTSLEKRSFHSPFESNPVIQFLLTSIPVGQEMADESVLFRSIKNLFKLGDFLVDLFEYFSYWFRQLRKWSRRNRISYGGEI